MDELFAALIVIPLAAACVLWVLIAIHFLRRPYQ